MPAESNPVGEGLPQTVTPKENKKKPSNCMGKALNIIAIAIITAVVFTLLISVISYSCNSTPKENFGSMNFMFDSTKVKNVDTTIIIANSQLIKSLTTKFDSIKSEMHKIKEIKNEIEESKRKNEDYFKLILALIGSVFAIVGFFGFKSISDTRQATIDAAKIKAEDTAQKAAKDKAEESVKAYMKNEGELLLKVSSKATAEIVAKEVAFTTSTDTAKATAKQETQIYLADMEEFRKALRQDLQSLQKENNILRNRIVDLETKRYGTMPPEESQDPAESNKNVEPVV
jgi:cell division protein FtsB